jgi:hypothetical protein
MEQFEHDYNFRYEEKLGNFITTHARDFEDTMRRKDETRKQ